MEWNHAGLNTGDSNPWLPASPSLARQAGVSSLVLHHPAGSSSSSNPLASASDKAQRTSGSSTHQSSRSLLLDNSTGTLAGSVAATTDAAGDGATRPSLSRLASSSGFLNGLERLAGNGSANASHESLSTRADELTGHRRSLEELRKMSIKGKARALQATDLGESSLAASGREAILHDVQKGDSLVGISLMYGCTAQAIRTANKLWLNDPIQLRKSLFVPLDACTQPPSKGVEFVQLPGQDAIQMYTTTSTAAGEQLSITRLQHHNRALLQSRNAGSTSMDTPYRDSDSPFASRRPSLSGTANRPTPSDFIESYLPSTNSDYGDSSDHYASVAGDLASSAGQQTPPLHALDLPSEAVSRTHKTLRIVRLPIGSVKSPGKLGRSPLHEATTDVLIPVDEARASSVIPTLTPSSSNDRLSALVPGGALNQRFRPRSPLNGDATSISTGHQRSESDSIHATASAAAPRTSLQRPRKISKDSVPTLRSARSSGSLLATGSSFLSSLLGTSGGKPWLGIDDYEEEMQLARDYRSKLSAPGPQRSARQPTPARKKSTDTIVQRTR